MQLLPPAASLDSRNIASRDIAGGAAQAYRETGPGAKVEAAPLVHAVVMIDPICRAASFG
jgi:hypothetical protein